MSSNIPINQAADITAPTPQNTPLTHAPIAAGLSRPTVPDIAEDPAAEAMDEDEAIASAFQTGAMRSALASMVQSRLNSLVGKSSGYIESLPLEVKRTVAALHGVQVKQNELHNQFKREFWELERKVSRSYLFRYILITLTCDHFTFPAGSSPQYLNLQKPLYERRNALIHGSSLATTEEIEAGEALSQKDDPDYTPLPKSEGPTPSTAPIPEFWLTALRNHIGISELITDRDVGALKHLIDIQLSFLPDSDDKPGFKLSFVFTPNEFFENTVLEKTYIYQKEIDYSGDFMYDHAEGTQIKWKEEKDLTKVFEVKKQRNKSVFPYYIHLILDTDLNSCRHEPHASGP